MILYSTQITILYSSEKRRPTCREIRFRDFVFRAAVLIDNLIFGIILSGKGAWGKYLPGECTNPLTLLYHECFRVHTYIRKFNLSPKLSIISHSLCQNQKQLELYRWISLKVEHPLFHGTLNWKLMGKCLPTQFLTSVTETTVVSLWFWLRAFKMNRCI